MASDQMRKQAFGAVETCVPELFPGKMLLFVDGEEWRVVRGSVETNMTDESRWAARAADLHGGACTKPCNLGTLTKVHTDKMVATAVWYLIFGVQLTDAQAATAAKWGASGIAGYFIFPRLIHRIAFNLLLGKVKQLRKDTIGIVRAHGLEAWFEQQNRDLPAAYQRESALALCDEMMYGVNFAGVVGGTCHGCWGTLQFMRRSTVDVPSNVIQYPEGSMTELYKYNPTAFIKEAVRLDAPVTSATCAFREEHEVAFDVACCGGQAREHSLNAGTLHQYVLSIANRAPSQFEQPEAFNPARPNLDDMLSWNGTVAGGSAEFPRFCPGHKLSLAVIQAICGLLEEVA
eukprot:CAMPEP_0115855434 /NCGR_PEP_ID=MMETSP0287-20121206/14539_1 /TAXON_ID=412157 /ORGANISM="Chrysochromulina rotalis, Strain UIO044" /LENGTH=345 /DNA_ID=CAMNT_0003309585 /DNA_START=353 /DNA_END=1392 /DNA_ORIENTATION=+